MKVAVIIPAHDEAAILEKNATLVWEWGKNAFDDFVLVLSENGSHDSTAWVAKLMEKLLPGTLALSSKVAGKGAAIKRAGTAVEADIYLFMDADLSADLASAERIARAVRQGADLAIGSRRVSGADVRRPLMRKCITAIYAFVVARVLRLAVRDPQCGCKAFSRRVRDSILPTVHDDGFFFDTELLARAHMLGVRVEEIGILWSERTRASGGSKVRLLATSLSFLKKTWMLRKTLSEPQVFPRA